MSFLVFAISTTILAAKYTATVVEAFKGLIIDLFLFPKILKARLLCVILLVLFWLLEKLEFSAYLFHMLQALSTHLVSIIFFMCFVSTPSHMHAQIRNYLDMFCRLLTVPNCLYSWTGTDDISNSSYKSCSGYTLQSLQDSISQAAALFYRCKGPNFALLDT